jgi:hypothetical protein
MPAVLGNITEVYFLPFLAVSHLRMARSGPGRQNGHQVFSRLFTWQRFIGYEPDTPMLELDVDPGTQLVSDVRFFTLEGNQSPVRLSYSHYFRVDGIAVPGRVEQLVDDVLLKTLVVQSVQFGVSFPDQDFSSPADLSRETTMRKAIILFVGFWLLSRPHPAGADRRSRPAGEVEERFPAVGHLWRQWGGCQPV